MSQSFATANVAKSTESAEQRIDGSAAGPSRTDGGQSSQPSSSPPPQHCLPLRREMTTSSARGEHAAGRLPIRPRQTNLGSACLPAFDSRYIVYKRIGQGSTGGVFSVMPRHLSTSVSITSASIAGGRSAASATRTSADNKRSSHSRRFSDPTAFFFACKNIALSSSVGDGEGTTGDLLPVDKTSSLGVTTTSLKQAMNEISIMQRLHHPRLVKLHEYFIEGNSCKLVMEMLRGENLGYVVKERGRLFEEDAKRIVKGILQGIEHMHEQGIAHRDLKLENIMMVDSFTTSEVKIIDLGLAKKLQRYAGDFEHLHHTMCGSPMYMAPEMISTATAPRSSHRDAADERGGNTKEVYQSRYGLEVDMWSCGVILYHILSGRPPFDVGGDGGGGIPDLFNRIISGNYSLDREPSWSLVSDEAKDLVARLMELDHKKRLTATQALGHPWLRTGL